MVNCEFELTHSGGKNSTHLVHMGKSYILDFHTKYFLNKNLVVRNNIASSWTIIIIEFATGLQNHWSKNTHLPGGNKTGHVVKFTDQNLNLQFHYTYVLWNATIWLVKKEDFHWQNLICNWRHCPQIIRHRTGNITRCGRQQGAFVYPYVPVLCVRS